jgi:hypothetical protein
MEKIYFSPGSHTFTHTVFPQVNTIVGNTVEKQLAQMCNRGQMMYGNNVIILHNVANSGDTIILHGLSWSSSTEIYVTPIYISPRMHCTAVILACACDTVSSLY